jgi:mannose-6-phosphate isomerase-like protein (cupin superfamily)
MNVYTVAELDAQRASTGESWVEFARSASMSTGLYVLDTGEPDRQTPHLEDEIYVCVSGTARFVAGDDPVGVEVGPGTVLFVPALESHHFEDVVGPLRLVVIFAPPESEAVELDADS